MHGRHMLTLTVIVWFIRVLLDFEGIGATGPVTTANSL